MNRSGDIYSLYGITPNGVPTICNNDTSNQTNTIANAQQQQCFIKQEVKQELGTNCMVMNRIDLYRELRGLAV